MNRHEDWLRQAANDLEWARHSFSGRFYAQTCFIAQHAAEKALKSYAFFKGYDVIKSHSLFQIVRAPGEDGELEQWARELDVHYITGRYPDAFPGGAPFEILTEDQARRAVHAAEELYRTLSARIGVP